MNKLTLMDIDAVKKEDLTGTFLETALSVEQVLRAVVEDGEVDLKKECTFLSSVN